MPPVRWSCCPQRRSPTPPTESTRRPPWRSGGTRVSIRLQRHSSANLRARRPTVDPRSRRSRRRPSPTRTGASGSATVPHADRSERAGGADRQDRAGGTDGQDRTCGTDGQDRTGGADGQDRTSGTDRRDAQHAEDRARWPPTTRTTPRTRMRRCGDSATGEPGVGAHPRPPGCCPGWSRVDAASMSLMVKDPRTSRDPLGWRPGRARSPARTPPAAAPRR